MNLREMREAHPDLFAPQDWFDGEQFMLRPAQGVNLPDGVSVDGKGVEATASAADLAWLYIKNPTIALWARYLWTGDSDDQHRHIYVGGIGQGKKPGFQIHRHLEITDLWGWPTWQ